MITIIVGNLNCCHLITIVARGRILSFICLLLSFAFILRRKEEISFEGYHVVTLQTFLSLNKIYSFGWTSMVDYFVSSGWNQILSFKIDCYIWSLKVLIKHHDFKSRTKNTSFELINKVRKLVVMFGFF